jgi:hypothetical protein
MMICSVLLLFKIYETPMRYSKPLLLFAIILSLAFYSPVTAQSGTTVVKAYAPSGITMRGSLADRTLNFFAQDYGYVALQGIHAMTPPGLYPLTLEGKLPSGESFAFSQNVLVQDAHFPYAPACKLTR